MIGFQTTRWSVVLDARGNEAQARRALDELCRTYRAPVVAYVRRHARDADDAEDLSQSFFEQFIAHAIHARADPARGAFRAFLLASLKNFLRDANDHRNAIKRGGEMKFESLEWQDHSDQTPDASPAPDEAFERDWAQAMLRAAMRRLQAETVAAGKGAIFEQMCGFLIERPSDADYERIGAALKMRRNTVAVAVHRLRQRLQDLMRDELADTTLAETDATRESRDLRPSLAAVFPAGGDNP
ncbi:MAG: sigma-70 family RNA polymerase sigma factor [Proteobacteria bacterium]|nr:sigma-70 family RNA polymerase sigma factor [Pseudomonadota bacterium]